MSKECCLDHAVDESYEVRGIFVVALISKDHVACHPWLVVQDVVIAVEDMLSISHAKGNDTAKGPHVRCSAVGLEIP